MDVLPSPSHYLQIPSVVFLCLTSRKSSRSRIMGSADNKTRISARRRWLDSSPTTQKALLDQEQDRALAHTYMNSIFIDFVVQTKPPLGRTDCSSTVSVLRGCPFLRLGLRRLTPSQPAVVLARLCKFQRRSQLTTEGLRTASQGAQRLTDGLRRRARSCRLNTTGRRKSADGLGAVYYRHRRSQRASQPVSMDEVRATSFADDTLSSSSL